MSSGYIILGSFREVLKERKVSVARERAPKDRKRDELLAFNQDSRLLRRWLNFRAQASTHALDSTQAPPAVFLGGLTTYDPPALPLCIYDLILRRRLFSVSICELAEMTRGRCAANIVRGNPVPSQTLSCFFFCGRVPLFFLRGCLGRESRCSSVL